ncbi:MAG TPA: NUDIX domain-containing protein [Chryseosolibacter sp.]
MPKSNIAAGLLMCRINANTLNYFLVHPGGPFFKNKDEGVWSIPKGIPETDNEELLRVAIREFEEETGIRPSGQFISIGYVKQKAGKVVHAWAFLGEWDSSNGIKSNTFSIEWPPRSGKFQTFPEMDRAEWFTYEEAIKKINPAQIQFLDRAKELLGYK